MKEPLKDKIKQSVGRITVSVSYLQVPLGQKKILHSDLDSIREPLNENWFPRLLLTPSLTQPWESVWFGLVGSQTPPWTVTAVISAVTVGNCNGLNPYRVTHHIDSNLLLRWKYEPHILKHNFCFDVNRRFESKWCVTLYKAWRN